LKNWKTNPIEELEDESDAPAAQLGELVVGELGEIGAVDDHPP